MPKLSKQYSACKEKTSASSSWPQFGLFRMFTHLLLVLSFLGILLLIKLGRSPFQVANYLTAIITRLLHAFHFRKSPIALYLQSYQKTQKIRFRRRQLLPKLWSILKILMLLHRKKPGRPRTTSWISWQLHKIARFFKHLIPRPARFRLVLSVLGVTFLVYSVLIIKLTTELPSPKQLTTTARPLTTEIYDRNGRLLYQIYEGQNRKLAKLEDLPPFLIQATIAIEDKHFLNHPGVDLVGIMRALRSNIQNGKREGGSTLTQQLIKNTLLTSDQTLSRKIKEAFLAFWAERIYSKEDILAMYFNEAPYGGPAWGIEAAAEMYFGKEARDLSLPEATFLAGMPVSPTQYSPYGVHPEEGKQRQKEVLRRMVEDGYISEQQAISAFNEELVFRPPTHDIKAPHFVMYIRSILASKYGERVVSQGGLKVVTTLDLDIQEMAENIVADQVGKLTALNASNGAAMITDNYGRILAMVGSKDYFGKEGNFNVTLALRQPGSSIKPITYATAFKLGYSPGNILLDAPTNFPNPWGQGYAPVNYDGKFHGPVTIRTALGSSYNVPAVKMLAITGIPAMLQTAREMGLTTLNNPEQYGLSLTLGGGAVHMAEMMGVYTTLAANGTHFDPQGISTVTNAYGEVLEDNQSPVGRQVLTPEVAYLVTNILADNTARQPAFGIHSLLEIPGFTVAVKTGTSDDKRDNWAFGYTPEYVVGAWVGNNNYSPMHPGLASGITGATPIWHDIMVNLLAGRPNIAFNRPSGIIETVVDGHKDLAISGSAPKTVIGFKTEKTTDQTNGKETETITYTDPFSVYIPGSSGFNPAQAKTTR